MIVRIQCNRIKKHDLENKSI